MQIEVIIKFLTVFTYTHSIIVVVLNNVQKKTKQACTTYFWENSL